MATEPVRIDKDQKERIEEYHERAGLETKSETATRVVERGLREVEGPMASRLRDMALTAAFHLTMVACVLVALGWGTRMLSPGRGMAIALVTLTIALFPVAAIESWRVATGQSELGDVVRGDRL